MWEQATLFYQMKRRRECLPITGYSKSYFLTNTNHAFRHMKVSNIHNVRTTNCMLWFLFLEQPQLTVDGDCVGNLGPRQFMSLQWWHSRNYLEWSHVTQNANTITSGQNNLTNVTLNPHLLAVRDRDPLLIQLFVSPPESPPHTGCRPETDTKDHRSQQSASHAFDAA